MRPLALISLPLIALACGGTIEDKSIFLTTATGERNCEPVVQKIMKDQCTSCHQSGSAFGGHLDLDVPNLGEHLLGQSGQCPPGPLVDPVAPEKSTLFLWVNAEVSDCNYQVMPALGAPLNISDKECLLSWIDDLDGKKDYADAN